MSYAMMGLGTTGAEARRRNDEQEMRDFSVGPGFWSDYLDAALDPHGIPGTEASRVPAVIREVLTANGNEVDRVVWGGGSGLESIRGKVYVKWKPSRPYNAVTYADIARRLFMSAADQFPAGARLVMHRYRVPGAPLAPLRGGFLNDKFVYPESGPIPASAPEAAHRTNVEDIPVPSEELMRGMESVASNELGPWLIAGMVGGGALLVGGIGFMAYRAGRKPKRNRRRRRTSR